MEINLVFLLCIALIFVVDTNKVYGEGEVVSSSITNSNLTDSGLRGSEINRTNVTDSKSIDDSKKSTNDTLLVDGSKMMGGNDRDNSKSEDKIASETTKEEAMSTSSTKKEGFHGEECDPSNMCTDEEDEFVACLRVPGNDAPHLSLLIQSRGKSALIVTITAPSFVRLEKDKVQLLENENTKVKVTIKKGESIDNAIILTSRKGHCSLDLKDLAAAHETGNGDTVAVSRPSIFNIRLRTLIVIIMISFLVLSLIIIPMIIHVYKNKSQGNNKYQRLDMELPVSNTGLVIKSDHESGDDRWNNNWGDDWDDENGNGDEEQTNAAILPLTPSLSSRGLASRRLSKEVWKD